MICFSTVITRHLIFLSFCLWFFFSNSLISFFFPLSFAFLPQNNGKCLVYVCGISIILDFRFVLSFPIDQVVETYVFSILSLKG